MGFGTKAPAQTTADRARGRRESGARIYVVTLLFASLPQWGDQIEEIEAEGWKLDAFTLAKEGHAVAVFRAAGS